MQVSTPESFDAISNRELVIIVIHAMADGGVTAVILFHGCDAVYGLNSIVRWTPSMIYVGGGIDEYNLLVTKTPNDVFVHWFGRKL